MRTLQDYLISEDSPKAAARMTERIGLRIDDLLDMPFQGREGKRPGTRVLVVTRTPYVVVYRVRGSSISILTVRHAARKPPA